MIFLRYSNTALEANCYIMADPTHRVALVVDAGAGSAAWVERTLAARHLRLGAVLATHGHGDHVWDAGVVAGSSVPCFIAEPDAYRLDNPIANAFYAPLVLAATGGRSWVKPEKIVPLPEEIYAEGMELVPGVHLRALATPGHTEGSTVFLFSGRFEADPETPQLPDWGFGENFMITGDVLFRDGVGRTDLAGGNDAQMRASLRTIVAEVDGSTIFFPGHGKPSTLARELKASPYLRAYIAMK
ncbi:MBL fold metallo-hydrolase [Actinotignum schaalii]|uniref:Metallo-beta-lactamase domain-containing protein n=1 Tax=Actinotignum schaalii FB123-CNA-2 TaxID=883067 RepID=S2VJZ1_9ACTO|nr:MBL fold metallo-hydrolase [Actinotignum schaalii]EPD27121.1 hypothetical protein HMPREF9237_01064 [Actinotignum schaalii FB123-CNA-2]